MIALACISIALGLWFRVSALANWEWYKGIVDFAAVEVLFDENATRWLCGIVGVAVLAFGVLGLFQQR